MDGAESSRCMSDAAAQPSHPAGHDDNAELGTQAQASPRSPLPTRLSPLLLTSSFTIERNEIDMSTETFMGRPLTWTTAPPTSSTRFAIAPIQSRQSNEGEGGGGLHGEQGRRGLEQGRQAVTGNGFIARDIGFHNTAGPQGEQALALYIASDHSVFFRCSIAGYQDSLYALALRQFYRECDIYGTIDFIFGNAVAVFQSCNLVLRRPQRGYNVILANGRNDPGQNTGFSIQKCKIMVSSDFSAVKHSYNSYLGRPWKEYSRAVIMESTLDDAIAPRGWTEWPGAESSTLKNLYFAEYSNVGPGAGLSKRVQWSGYHVIGADKAVKFTVSKFIAGTSWLPFTGIPFISGLD
ncbi:hypothetical protein SO802_030044 [Lithocarpus litseifolius]|uniref:Pectinesterase n=1 Tax=Lithocarpus litseifolius TaxID=425828 RepID=A0AAW2C0F3_9ROSI